MSQNVQSERSVSLWMPAPEIPGKPVTDSRPADLVVIGGGMAGLSVAYQALLKGRQVTILDRGAIASGMTARTTAHLASALDDRYYEFIGLRGEAQARLLYESLAASIDRIEEIARQESIACDFQRCDGYLFLGEGDKIDILEKEIDACHKIGFTDVSWEKRAPFPTLDSGRCLRFPNQARFHPLKYLEGLARAILTKGGVFRPYTAVDEVKQDGASVAVKTRDGQTILARDVVCATNAPIAGRLTLQAKMAPYRSYAMSFEIPKGSANDALYWDTLDPYHYVRLNPGPGAIDYLIAGGEDHKSGEADDGGKRFAAIEAWIRKLVPTLGNEVHRWSGQVMTTIDRRLFDLDKMGIDIQVVAPAPGQCYYTIDAKIGEAAHRLDNDGVADSSDYIVYRNTLGQTGIGLAADAERRIEDGAAQRFLGAARLS